MSTSTGSYAEVQARELGNCGSAGFVNSQAFAQHQQPPVDVNAIDTYSMFQSRASCTSTFPDTIACGTQQPYRFSVGTVFVVSADPNGKCAWNSILPSTMPTQLSRDPVRALNNGVAYSKIVYCSTVVTCPQTFAAHILLLYIILCHAGQPASQP